jgi:RNA polymerase sigma-70 factor (ECF subfamily)
MDSTPVSLLERLQQAPDEAGWQRLVRLYTPLLFFWARRAGESEHDAADLVQDVFAILIQSLPGYRRQANGSFRDWLKTFTLNKLRERRRRAALARQVPLASAPEPPDCAEAFWDAEYRQALIQRALQLMQTDFAPRPGKPAGNTSRGAGPLPRWPASLASARMRCTSRAAACCDDCGTS